MLENIGIDTRGSDKEALIKSCKSHSDISTFCLWDFLSEPDLTAADMKFQAVILPDFSVLVGPSDCAITQQGEEVERYHDETVLG